ncbi:MAG: ABC transporter ATP-binding protein [bacterium]|nr:ABC transporter ATP-binding protein [bacterium]
MNSILSVSHLYKKFGEFTAVDKISFDLHEGEILGFLGPNGAGKTTTIQMLLGLTEVNSGEIKYFNKDFIKNRQHILQRINFTSSFNALQGRISVKENLIVFAGLYSVKNSSKKISELSEYFDTGDLMNKKYWDLSAGQKTRVNIIKSLLNDPEILLMDEPTASLDPDVADKLLTLIETLKKSRRLSILYTSHEMDEVTRICDRVIFISHGKIVAEDTPKNLTKKITDATIKIRFVENKDTLEKYLQEKGLSFVFTDTHKVEIISKEQDIPKLIFGISKIGIYITDIEIEKPSLEDVFLKIARHEYEFHQ